jgi:anti-sigma factor RsiW
MTASGRHISHEKLADLIDGRATREERAQLMTHISDCHRCGNEYQGLERLIALMGSDNSEDAPRDVLSNAINLFRGHFTSREPLVLRRLIAALSFDSLTMAPAFGVRSGQAASRQLIYSAEENDIDLRLTFNNEMWVVSGQVLREDCGEGRVEIDGPGGFRSAALNETCEFVLPAVSPGDYVLRVSMPGVVVEIPQLELKR